MSYLYAVTSQKPTAVNFSIVCNFTSATEKNLILAKSNHLEIYSLKENGLTLLTDVGLFGSIKALEFYRPSGSNQDVLFVLTERKKISILAYDSVQKKIITKSMGNVKDRIGRDAEMGQRGFIDPEGKMIGLILYDGLLKVIPVDANGLKDAFNLPLEENRIIDIKFLHGCIRPTLCILYEDNRRSRHVKTSGIDLREKELISGTWQQNNVDFSASLLIPVPSPLNGVIVIGLTTITYISGTGIIQTVEISPTQICSYCRIDPSGTRYLLSDNHGQLMVLALHVDPTGNKVISITTDILGTTSIAETISYLENGIVFIGSTLGDSQLIKLHPPGKAPAAIDGNNNNNSNGNIENLDYYTNIGPIVDMCLVDNHAAGGQKQLVTCSGAYKDGSLRIIRSGIGIHEQASLEIPGIKGVWSLRTSEFAEYDKYLVQSFTTETRILAIEGEELGEIEIPGFQNQLPTIYCNNVANGLFVQVTSYSVRLIDCQSYQLLSEYPANKTITGATGDLHKLILTLSGGEILYFELNDATRAYELRSNMILDQDVACMSFYGFIQQKQQQLRSSSSNSTSMEVDEQDQEDPAAAAADHLQQASNLLAVGMWTDNTIRLLTLPTLQEVTRTVLTTDTQARDLLLTSFEKKIHLFIGLGDGNLISYNIELSHGLPVITNRRKGVLGTHPIKFSPFKTIDNELCVFAACDRPTVIYMRNGKLLFSIMNINATNHNNNGNNNNSEVTEMTQFHSELFPDCLALCSETNLLIGTVEDIQKVHIQTIPLGEAPRRIAHCNVANVYAVTTEKTTITEKGEESISRILFFDDGSFDLIGSFDLDYLEQGISIATVQFEGTKHPFFVVGTAQTVNDELEPSKGRILVFDVSSYGNEDGNNNPAGSSSANQSSSAGGAGEKKINLLTERETKSGVYSLVGIQGRLAAGIGSKVQIYKLNIKDESSMTNFTSFTSPYELQNECHHQGHIMTLYLKSSGDHLIVGDLVRSISLLKYRSTESTLEEIARDFNSNFMRAVEIMEGGGDGGHQEYYLGCDDHANLFCLTRKDQLPSVSTTGAVDEDAMKLEVRGEYHIGDYVNVLRRGSLIIQPIDSTHDSHNNNASNHNSNHRSHANTGHAAAANVSSSSSNNNIFDPQYKSITGYPTDHRFNVLYGTISGALGNLIVLNENSFKFFSAIEKAMKNFLTPIGGFAHEDWRTFQNEMRSSSAKNILDGDLIEMFLDLNKDQVEILTKEINEELSHHYQALASNGSNNNNNNNINSNNLNQSLPPQPPQGPGSSSASSSLPVPPVVGGDHQFVSNLLANRVHFSSEEIYRRIEDIARLH